MNDGPEQRVRIQKALADAGVASRRRAEEMVAAGRVTVNGVDRVDRPDRRSPASTSSPSTAATDQRRAADAAVPGPRQATGRDQHGQRPARARDGARHVPPRCARTPRRLYPVGRLDRDSEGLLLLTNDGDWAQRMLHPSHGIERDYMVGVDGPIGQTAQRRAGARRPIRRRFGHDRSDWRPATSAELRQLAQACRAGRAAA